MAPVPVFDLHCDVLLNRFQWGRDVLRHSDKPNLLGTVAGKTGRALMRLLGKGDYIHHQCDIPLLAEAGYQRAILGFHSFLFYHIPSETRDCRGVQRVFLKLKTDHNWSDADIARVAHGNAIRFFSDWSNPPYPQPNPNHLRTPCPPTSAISSS